MTSLAALLPPLAALALPPDTAVQAVAAALAVPGARAEVVDLRTTSGASCPAVRAEALHPVTGSGSVGLRLTGTGPDGRPCQAFAWARVRVTTEALVTSRPVALGESLQGAVVAAAIELRPGLGEPMAELPAGGRAARALPAGAPLLAGDIRQGPMPGEPITVTVRSGGIEISQVGRALPCDRGRACAVLPGGRRVEGRLEAGRLILEAP